MPKIWDIENPPFKLIFTYRQSGASLILCGGLKIKTIKKNSMKTMQQWLDEYGESHRNRINKLIHYVCVPAIYMTVMGLFWAVPFVELSLPIWLNWASILALPVMVFYFRLSSVVGIGMTLFTAIVIYFLTWWEGAMQMSVLMMSVIVFVVAWILQFIGHHIERKKPSFFKDLQFLLIGPAWIFCHLLKKFNLKF